MDRLGYLIFRPNATLLKTRGYDSIAHVPVIFKSQWKYDEEASRYLRERSSPSREDVHRGVFRSRRQPTVRSLQSYAERLVNFLDWCETRDPRNKSARGIPYWKEVGYDAVTVYGQELEKGTFSTKGKLATTTVEVRKDTAVEFLEWAAARGLRDPIDIPRKQVHIRVATGNGSHALHLEAAPRADKKRVVKDSLRIPTDSEIESWLRSLRIRFGHTKHLMVELILATGIRINEIANWQVDTLPLDKSKWRMSRTMGRYVTVKLIFGAKGPKSDGPAGVLGPPRNITIPIELAEKIWEYQEYARPKLLRLFVKQGKTKAEQAWLRSNLPKQLFLSDYAGVPVTTHRLREAWKAAAPLPFPEWRPHFGRDYWACKTLMFELQRQMQAAKIHSDGGIVTNWMQANAETIITMMIRPQLGHLSQQTTTGYLQWALGAFDLTVLHDMYARTIGDICKDSSLDSAI